jgi:hypothetical protein
LPCPGTRRGRVVPERCVEVKAAIACFFQALPGTG